MRYAHGHWPPMRLLVVSKGRRPKVWKLQIWGTTTHSWKIKTSTCGDSRVFLQGFLTVVRGVAMAGVLMVGDSLFFLGKAWKSRLEKDCHKHSDVHLTKDFPVWYKHAPSH